MPESVNALEQYYRDLGPATANPNFLAQGRRANVAQRSMPGPTMQAANTQLAKEFSSMGDRGAIPDLINRGLIANTAGLPVDLLNTVLQSLGLGAEQPVGGSDSIRRALEYYGLSSDTQRPMLETLAGLTPPKAVMGAARAAGQGAEAVGRAAAPVAGQAIENYMVQSGSVLPVVKMGGGNWVNNSVEKSLENIKGNLMDYPRPFYGAPDHPANIATIATNNWVDKQLTNYVKNQMGTAGDPITALAEKGILHFEPGATSRTQLPKELSAKVSRRMLDMPEENTAVSNLAKTWENYSDSAITGAPYRLQLPMVTKETANQELSLLGGDFAVKNPNAFAYAMNRGADTQGLGFNKLYEEIRNATYSGASPANNLLPKNLQIKPESLERLSVPQAVERVAKINKWKASEQIKADLNHSKNEATIIVKEYPNEGMNLVRLKLPSAEIQPNRDIANKSLKDALNYEGRKMNHCIGSYCQKVAMQDGTEIYSLRDKKGIPHVTIEVESFKIPYKPGEAQKLADAQGLTGDDWNRYVNSKIAEGKETANSAIKSIQGNSNQKPAEKYWPAIQDFINSRNWMSARDSYKVGLINKSDLVDEFTTDQLQKMGKGEFISNKDLKLFRANNPGAANHDGWADKTPRTF